MRSMTFRHPSYGVIAALIVCNLLLLVYQIHSVVEREGLAVGASTGGLLEVAGDLVPAAHKLHGHAIHTDPLDTAPPSMGHAQKDDALPPQRPAPVDIQGKSRARVPPKEDVYPHAVDVGEWEMPAEVQKWTDFFKERSGRKWTSDDVDELQPPAHQWPTKRSHVCILTACSGPKYAQKGSLNGRTIAEHTWRNKQLYAKIRGYDAVNVDLEYYKKHSRAQLTGRHRLFVWAKIAVLKGCLYRYRYCLWIDADGVFTNPQVSVESFFQQGVRHSDLNDNDDDSNALTKHEVPGMVIGKTFELMGSNDMNRLPAGPSTYRLNTGIIALKSSAWSREFLKRTWDMEGLPQSAKRDYIEGLNHEQSTMQYFMLHNTTDHAQTHFPASQVFNIHNSFSGPRDKWQHGDFLVHYYGGFQGGCHSPHHQEGNNKCIDEFIDRNMEVAEAAPKAIRDLIYTDWATDREVSGRGEFDDHVEHECVSSAMRIFGMSQQDQQLIQNAMASWPPVPGMLRKQVKKHSSKFQWSQELYVRLQRLLFWKYILPVNYSRGGALASDLPSPKPDRAAGAPHTQLPNIRLVSLEMKFLPWLMDTQHVRGMQDTLSKTARTCLVLGEVGIKYVGAGGLMSSLCPNVDHVISSRECEALQQAGPSGVPKGATCLDVDDDQAWKAAMKSDHYDVVLSVYSFDKYSKPWEVAARVKDVTKVGGVLVWAVPSITGNTADGSVHRWTVEGAKTMWEQASMCVMRVMPLSNVMVTVAAILGYHATDLTLPEHLHTDPVAPLGVAVMSTKCQSGRTPNCCKYEGVETRKAVDCWRGLYGGRDKNGAMNWGCNRHVGDFDAWDGEPWYDLDFGIGGHKTIKSIEHANSPTGTSTDKKKDTKDKNSGFRSRGEAAPGQESCQAPLLRSLGFNPRVQKEMEDEVAQWAPLPRALTGPLLPLAADRHPPDDQDAAAGRRRLQALFLRMHRVLFYLNQLPFDMNMGWIRGTPLDRVFLNRVFFPYINRKNIKGGRCLEWGNTYMGGDLAKLCPHQYEIAEHKDPCKGKYGQFDSSVDYSDVRPFHVTGQREKFKGGFCADIHHSQGVIPDKFFDVVICTFVFEHLHSPWLAAQAMYDMTAPGGYLVWAAPNAEVYHANPGDNWRYTPAGSKTLFEDVGYCVIKVMPCSTSSVTAGFFMGFSDTDFEFAEMEAFDPYMPHTVAVLAQRPKEEPGFECPPYEGVDLGLRFRCWMGEDDGKPDFEDRCASLDSTTLTTPSAITGGTKGYGWDGIPFHAFQKTDQDAKFRPARPIGPNIR